MKPAPFAYARPRTVDDAVELLVASKGEGKVLAGGQSLVPVLAMRLARPTTLVDINAVHGLDVMARRQGPRGPVVEIGATVRQRRVEHDPVAAEVPLLGLALPWVGHRELRSRGTVCGSLAHADPAAELPAVACCLGAELDVVGPRGARRVAAAEFFAGAMTTAVGSDEILVSSRWPVAKAGEGFGFAEVARRHGDFALAGVAAKVVVSSEGSVASARLSFFGVSDRPVSEDVTGVVRDAVSQTGRLDAALGEAMRDLAERLVDTSGDPHGSTAYRRRLAAHLAARQLSAAYAGALGEPHP